jgi:hypothetical protein
MRNALILLTALLPLTTACSKKGGGACKALSVTIDGKAIPGLGHGLARVNKMHDERNWEVDLFNHDKVTCEQFNSKSGRSVAEGEISVRAFAGGEGMMGAGVGIDSHTQSGVTVNLTGDKPKVVGDKVTICVDNASFKPMVGANKDKTVVIDGLFEGSYCGEMSF